MMNSLAKWIASPENYLEGCSEFYFDIKEKKSEIVSAKLSASALGIYKPYVNGSAISSQLFTPYFTAYNKRIQYQTYDITDMLNGGDSISFLVGEGWAVGNFIAVPGINHRYSDKIALIFSLEIELKDGNIRIYASDESVKVRTSHVTHSSVYNGETVDMTVEIRELGHAVGFNYHKNLIPQEGEEVHEREIVYPVKLITTPKGERVIDFGQNMVGYVEVSTRGKRGDRIVISHAEILDKEGNFYTANLRSAKQLNTYVLSGEDSETFKPTLSWQGFRYIRLDEYPSESIDLADFRGIVVYSDIERSSYFNCGNALINQLYSNVIWGQKGNFVDIPTDCPQRDERLGWTGDAQVFVKTAAINFDVEKFFKKWMRDIVAEQSEDGLVGMYVPYFNIDHPKRAVAAWGDACVICPFEIYLAYGDREMLEYHYPSMKKWVDYIHKSGNEEFLWNGGSMFGDWLALDDEVALKSKKPTTGNTDTNFVAAAFFAYSTSLLIRTERILGYDTAEHEELLKNIKSAIRERFLENGVPKQRYQTAYTLALRFGLCEDNAAAAEILDQLVKNNGNRLTTGFVCTPHLLHALSENGYHKTAYDLLLQEKFPSWLYSVLNGATTIWEHWDGIREDGSVWNESMNSYNHYSYGAVFDWVFGVAAGIKVLDDGAGYKHITISPIPDERLGFIDYTINTRSGKVKSAWRYINGGMVRYEIEIPEGTVAEVALPNGRKYTLGGGSYTFYA